MLITIGGDASKLQDEISKLTTENAELKTKNEETLDKYRRSIAENDNMRKRLTKQIEDAKIFGIQGTRYSTTPQNMQYPPLLIILEI